MRTSELAVVKPPTRSPFVCPHSFDHVDASDGIVPELTEILPTSRLHWSTELRSHCAVPYVATVALVRAAWNTESTKMKIELLACLTLLLSSVTTKLFGDPPETGVEFGGVGRCASVENGEPFNLDQFTVATWVKLRQTDRAQIFVGRGQANELFTLYLTNNHVRMLVRHAADKYSYARVPAPLTGTWVHYAGTYDGSQIKLYVNGQLKATSKAPGRMMRSPAPLCLGGVEPGVRILDGSLNDVCLWDRVLAVREVESVAQSADVVSESGDGLVACWTADAVEGNTWRSAVGELEAVFKDVQLLSCEKADGYRGIWYSNQPQDNEYVYKYSGGLGTYCAKHRPLAIYRPEAQKTFFCYGGTNPQRNTLLHMVSYFDHATGMIPRPTILLDKRTTDAHDNPVISIDDKGYIWIFSSSHGTSRPSYISVSDEPYSIDSFHHVLTTNFSYTQPFYLPDQGFLFPQTIYRGGRAFYFQFSRDGRQWSEPTLLSLIGEGHYEISEPAAGGRLGSAFNYHPQRKGLNWRTNLYYIETRDIGKSWQNVSGHLLELPLRDPDNPALVHDYESEKLNVYMKDLTFDAAGNPIILFVTSRGWKAGPENDPRIWRTARWTGREWDIQGTIRSDNNYDMGSLYVESDGTWRLIAPTESGPQPYNPGGEVAMWTSRDLGRSWKMVKQLTRQSVFNHTYVRRPVNAHPDFYAFWADGHARRPSESRLYFTNRAGDCVWRLPETMAGESAEPEMVKRP